MTNIYAAVLLLVHNDYTVPCSSPSTPMAVFHACGTRTRR